MAASKVPTKPLLYIGNHDFLSKGKFLFEILTQLRNFGIGRIVTKAEWGRRFPNEPSYLRVQKVEPKMDRWLRKGRVFGEWTYRGQPMGIYEFANDLDKPDWVLIHRDQEKQLVKDVPAPRLSMPSSLPLPPLIQYQKKLEDADASLTMPCHYHLDEEHQFLKQFIHTSDDANPPPTSSVYDVGIAQDDFVKFFYGNEPPTKIEKWDVPLPSDAE